MFDKIKTIVGVLGIGFSALLFAETETNASLVWQNSPVHYIPHTTGGYSDAFSVGGTEWGHQSIATKFVLNENKNLQSVRWWGYVDPGLNETPSNVFENVAGFEINIWNSDFTQQIYSETYLLNQVEIERLSTLEGREHTFYTAFDNVVNAGPGTYFLNIGAIHHNFSDHSSESGGEDNGRWAWSFGWNSVHTEMGQNPSYATNNNWPWSVPDYAGQYWGQWQNYNDLAGFQITGGASALYAPTPGAIALLGLSGLIGNRRRR